MYGWAYDCFQYFAEDRWGGGSWEKIRAYPYDHKADRDDVSSGSVRQPAPLEAVDSHWIPLVDLTMGIHSVSRLRVQVSRY